MAANAPRVYGPESLEDVTKRKKAQAAKSLATRKTKQKIIKEGEKQRYTTIFYYADGRVAGIKMALSGINLLGLPIADENNCVVLQGKDVTVVDTVKTKPFKFSMVSRIARTGKQKGNYRREWKTISVPADAREVDVLHNYKQWKVKPEMIQVNGKSVVTGKIKNLATKAAAKRAPKPIIPLTPSEANS